MPTENTHLYFADRIAKINENCRPAVKHHLNSFYLGSIYPDTFYWTSRKRVRDIFIFIHKSSGKPLRNLIFGWLDAVKRNQIEKELVFLFGFLTHCALDSVFHPAINSIAGNVFDENPEKRKEAVYMHAYVECYIDNQFNINSFFKVLNISEIKKLAGIEFFAQRFSVKKGNLYSAFRKQKVNNLMYKNRMAYHMVFFLKKFNLCPLLSLSYFDEILKKDQRKIGSIIKYRHPSTGKLVEKTFDDLFVEAETQTADWFAAADQYYNGKLLREECEKIIDGRNLITGTV